MPSTLVLLLLPLVSVIADDRHLSETTTESTGGLGTGAIAGIIVGVLAVVSCGGAVLASFLTERQASRRESRRPLKGAQPVDEEELKLLRKQLKAAEDELLSARATVSSTFGDNNLPMMAMQVNPTSTCV